MIYILALVLLILLVGTYYGVNRDLMHPSVLVIASTFLSVLAAIYNIKTWNINYHFNTFMILILGLLCISITGIFISKLNLNKIKIKKRIYIQNQIININNTAFIITIIFNLIVLLWYYYIIIKATGGGSLTEMMALFRMIHSYGKDKDFSMPSLLNQFIKINKILAYIYIMLFLNNYIGFGKKNYKYLIPVILFCVQTLLGSDRIYIVMLLGSSVVMAYLIYHRKNGWQENINGKFLKIALKILITMLVLFYFAGNFIGHSSTKSDLLSYVTSYMGGSIQLLDMYIQDPIIENDAKWGEETFYSIYKTIMQLKGEIPPKMHLEFRSSNGVIIGNIYTAIRKYYHDFGISGVVILCSIFGIFYSSFYNMLKKENNSLISYRLCVYCFIVYSTFYFPLNEVFFSSIISINYLSMFIYMLGLYYVLIIKKGYIRVNLN